MRLGCKAAPADAATMADLPHVTFLETVLWGDHVADPQALEATATAYAGHDVHVVHAPFTVPGPRAPHGGEVDVASDDVTLRQRSIDTWHASCELAERLDARWVVLHPGGIAPVELAEDQDGWGVARAAAMERTEEALQTVGDQWGRARLLIENMPQCYHRNDGTTDRTLTGLALADLQAWADLVAGICLDTSHAQLTPARGRNLDVLAGRGGRFVRHLHLSDAHGLDGEGLPMGDGQIDWHRFRQRLAELDARHDDLTGVCEIKGGHEDGGAGFRTALEFCFDHLL